MGSLGPSRILSMHRAYESQQAQALKPPSVCCLIFKDRSVIWALGLFRGDSRDL